MFRPELPTIPESDFYRLVKQTYISTTYVIKIRDFFQFESSATLKDLDTFPNIFNVNPNAKNQRKRKKNKPKKDAIICYPYIGLDFGQSGSVNALTEPKEVYSHILGKSITALYDAASISHRIEFIYDHLHGDYKTPILQGAIQKDELKELAIKYRNPITGETINISNALAREIFLKSDEAKNDYLDYEMLITVESADMNPNTRSRNNKFINSGGGFEFWESIRCFENDVINYISDISFQTNEKENDKGVHPLFALENNDDINKEDKGLVLKNAKDKNASFFEHACYLYNDGMSAVQKLPYEQWSNNSAKEVADRLCSLELPTQPIVSWIKDVCDDGVSFFNEIPDKSDDLNKDFNSLSLLVAIRHNIEQRFGGKFTCKDWSKFANRINEICRTLTSSNEELLEKTWLSSATDTQTYPISKFLQKKNIPLFGLNLVLDRLYDTKKEDLGLTSLGVVVKPLTGISADAKRAIRTKQTKGEEIICDISGRPYPMDELEYCHIEANSMGLLNDTEVNEPENIRLAHRKYNRMMGTMNYTAFKKWYKSNSIRIDEQLMLT